MTVGKLAVLSWVAFGVMSLAFMPLIFAENSISALPQAGHIALAAFIVIVLWWGPFVYGMYLGQAVMGGGDRRLLKRGAKGTARVLRGEMTSLRLGGNSYGTGGRRVYRYRLLVNVNDRAPYETDVLIASPGIPEGEQVNVAVSRFNRKRVAIDVGQGKTKGYAPVWNAPAYQDPYARQKKRRSSGGPMRPVGDHFEQRGNPVAKRMAPTGVPQDSVPEDSIPPGYHAPETHVRQGAHSPEDARIRQLKELAKLHADGVLTDDEFAAEKARILNA